VNIAVFCSGLMYFWFDLFALIPLNIHSCTRLQVCTANIHAVEMYGVPLSASSILNDSRPESPAIPWNQNWTVSLSLSQNQLSCSFLARHSLAPFPFSVALFVSIEITLVISGTEGVEVHLW